MPRESQLHVSLFGEIDQRWQHRICVGIAPQEPLDRRGRVVVAEGAELLCRARTEAAVAMDVPQRLLRQRGQLRL